MTLLILVKELDQYSWTMCFALDQNQGYLIVTMTILQLKTTTMKMLVFSVNHVSISIISLWSLLITPYVQWHYAHTYVYMAISAT